MRYTFGYASICCILLHQLQSRDMMASITRGVPNVTIMWRKYHVMMVYFPEPTTEVNDNDP